MNAWILTYNDYKPGEEPLREVLCVLGNGYIAARGAGEETSDDQVHYPGTYLAGGYNRMKSEVAGEVIENEDFVNWPNWLCLTFKPEGGDWFHPEKMELSAYRQRLNLKEGVLERTMRIKDNDGRETELISKRLVHMGLPHMAGIQWMITPKNWSGRIIIKSGIDGRVINNGVARYSELNQRHLEFLDADGSGEDGVYLSVRTRQSRIKMTQAARTRVYQEGSSATTQRRTYKEEGYIEQEIVFEGKEAHTCRIEKIVTIYTSRDWAISEPAFQACKMLQRAPEFERLYEKQCETWRNLWRRCDIQIDGDEEDQLILRLHIFHMLQTTSKNIVDMDIGAPSRGLHGEAYRGHILWDELFIFPFLNFSIPEITRELLMYRYRRLDEARYLAREAGYKGAMYPWQSGSDGREESQRIHLNPESGRWIPDDTYLQRHVNAAIAYNIWQYYQVNNDIEFLSNYGAEMFLEIARFWASKAEYNSEKNKYEIKRVVGPDEYHTSYPGSTEPGVNNNAYTNVMAVWVIVHALKTIELITDDHTEALLNKLGIDAGELERWDKISRNMFVPMHSEEIIEQFEGFDQLEELDWEGYHEKYGEILRLDRILEKEGDDVNRYKASKQADVLMLFYLFSAEEIKELFDRLAYRFHPESIQNNINYYSKRSSHGSTLSKLVHSWVTARSNRDKSWRNFQKALASDFKDIQGGTTAEGIHLGAMAGTVDLIQRCYTGLEIVEDALLFNPALPDEVTRLATRLKYRSHWLAIELTKENLMVESDGGWAEEIKIIFKGKTYTLKKGDKKIFNLKNK